MVHGAGATAEDEPSEATSLAAHAEDRRRDGDADAALALAREALEHDPEHVAAHATAALALLDLGREHEARRELELLVAEPVALPMALDPIADDEFDRAFDAAEPEPDAMRDANEVAYEAMRAAALDSPEIPVPAGPGSPFRTATMAALLERQGDADAARAIRESLAPPADTTSGGRERRRGDRVRILERWLERLQRGNA
jgi:tetratricopeptide (TPR) repeat protein